MHTCLCMCACVYMYMFTSHIRNWLMEEVRGITDEKRTSVCCAN